VGPPRRPTLGGAAEAPDVYRCSGHREVVQATQCFRNASGTAF